MIDVKDISGTILLSTAPNDGCKRKFTLMKEDYITLKFSLDNPIYFKLGSYVECEFGLFEVCDLQKPIFNTNTEGYDYELQLDSHYWKWKNKVFKYTPETAGQEASWNLTATLDVQAGIVLRNLKALGYKYKGQDFVFSIDSTVENKSQLMSYDNINILDACFEMAKKWDCECWVTENIIHFGRCEFGDPVDFEIGVNVGEMSRSESQSTYATRIYAFGSTRNIPTNYRPVDESVVVNGVVQKRLMLPEGTPYIDAYPNMTTEEAIEQIVIFDEVYPRRLGTMSDVTTHEYTETIENADGTTTEQRWSAYRFKDTGITFSKDYILPGEELKITFHSGKLNGMVFAVTFDPEGKDEQLWEIVRNEDYGRPLPDEVLIPENGDTYVLSGWDSTKIAELGLVSSAEQELKDKAEKYVAKSKIDPNTYNCTMMSDDAYRENGIHNLYGIGQKVNLINKAYFENGRQSRIIGFEFNFDYPFDSPIYMVGETAAYSRIGELEEKLENITLAGQTYTGGSGSGVYLITSYDSTPATDSNAYSARRSLKMFLNKDRDDRTPYKLSSDTAFEVGQFVSGSTGGIIMVDKETGQVYAEVDKLRVRMKAYFESLEIQNVNSVGGKIMLTPGGAVTLIDVWTKGYIESTYSMTLADGTPIMLADGNELILSEREPVENGVPDGVYRCWFLAEQDGVEVENRFRAGFQVQSKNFNIKKPGEYQQVANHYYWRLCVGASREPLEIGIYKLHYIDLSMADCDTGSDIPAKGDTVAHLGARTKWKGIDGNDVTDESNIDAQNAVIMSSTDVFSPSVTLYHGIDSYSYLNKEYVEYGVDKINNKAFFHVYGDAYVGDRDGKSYVRFTQGEGVEIKGKLSVGTTIGNGDTIEDALKKASEKYKEDLDPLKDYINKELDNIQNQVDGAIETWFYEPEPTLDNLPASDWTTDDLKNNHLGDLYYSKEGKAYRFQYEQGKGWYWNAITDTDIIKALENAKKAQDTADGKRRIFVRQPQNSDAYDIGDMWVNATYGTTYKDDMLRANTAKKAGEAFSISHWELASKYTDDTVAKEAQKIAEETKKAAEKLDETVGSMKDFTDEAFKDGIVDRGEAAAIQKYLNTIATTQKDVTESYNKIIENELLDEGVVKTGLETAYRLFNNSAQELINTINGVIQDGKTTATEVAMVDGKYSAFNLKYGDFIANINAANNYIQEKLNASIKEISKNIGDISYLTKALKEYTNIEGGLIQSSLLALGYTSDSGFKIMSGTNGVYQSDKRGGGIASWWGGSMLDKFDYPENGAPENAAKGLVRFDGTGYFANGALWWEEDGTLHADPLSFFVGEETVGVLLSAFKFLRSAEFKYILEPQYPFTDIKAINSVKIGNALLKYDATNNALYVEKEDGTMANFYATGEVSAFGSTSGGSSGATSLRMLDDVDLTVPLSDGMVLTYDSIKSKWTNKKGGGLDISAMWAELSKSDTSKTIHFSHIPDLSSVYAKQVKLGTVAYSVASGVISLPAYPTIPTALKNPYGLTISLNGTSQGSYDGSASKSINITASSIGAAIPSDLSKYVLKAGDTITGSLTINGTTTTNNIVLNKAGNYGNKINFGDGDYVYLKEVTDDALTIYGSKGIYLNGSGFGYSFGSDGLVPTFGSKNLGGGWNSNMWSAIWADKIGCVRIGNNVNDVHDGSCPWYGINFNYNNKVILSGYYGIGFYTSAGQVASMDGETVNITNLSCYNNANCRASYVSSMTDRWTHTWQIFQNVDNAVFRANQIALMNAATSCRPILGWIDSMDGIGYKTHYAIGTVRTRNDGWGSMLIAVSNSDDGSTNGVHLQLNGEGTADMVASRFTVHGKLLVNGEVTAYSDIRLKSSIVTLRNRGFVTPKTYIKDGKESIGFIAQELRELYPELVTETNTPEKYLSVNYAQYTAVLQAQIIELYEEIKNLKDKFIN